MNNLFNELTKGIPKPKQADVDLLKSLEKPKETPIAQTITNPTTATSDFSQVNTRDLVKTWQKQSTPETTAELLKRMKPTISSAMNSFAPGMDDKLAVKAANLTLEALKRYDASFNTDPTTHVFHQLKRLNRLGARASNILPQSELFSLQQKTVRDAFDKFEDNKGRDPSIQELADLTGISKKKVEALLDNKNTIVSESATLTDETNKDTFSQSDITDNDYFEYVYASVSPIDQKIMEWSSGLHNTPALSNNQIAAKLNVSAAAISQHKAKIQQMLSDVRSLI